MRTKTLTVYNYSELSEEAKERACQEMLEHFDYPWSGENRDTLTEFENNFPVTVKDFRYGSCNSFVDFDFTSDDKTEELTGVRLLKYLHNNYYDVLFKGKYYSKTKYVDGKFSSKHRHSKVQKENCCTLTGYYIDDAILKPIYEFLKNPVEHINFYDLMNECLQSWLSAVNNDYEAMQSEEYLAEHAEVNEIEFDEDGNLA